MSTRGLVLGLALSVVADATPIIGFDSLDALTGQMYSISAANGVVTASGPGAGIALSTGPRPGTILYSSGVNVYEYNPSTGERTVYACTGGPCGAAGDHAWDRTSGVVYALGTLYPLATLQPEAVLLQLFDSGIPQPGVPDSRQVSYGLVGQLGVSGLTSIEYLPGIGLIGSDGAALYRINLLTGAATHWMPVALVLPWSGGITPLNGLAYDPGTGKLVASAAAGLGVGGPAAARLYEIQFPLGSSSALGIYLNETPPSLTGIAAVNDVPEPGGFPMLMVGLVLVTWAVRRVGRS